jgi:hypothetical protein
VEIIGGVWTRLPFGCELSIINKDVIVKIIEVARHNGENIAY